MASPARPGAMPPVRRTRAEAAPAAQSGQALLESLVAVAILAIALVSLLAGLVQLQDRRLEAARTRHAGQLAADKMTAVRLAGESGLTNADGVFPAPDDAFAWKVEVTTTPDALFRLLTVQVRTNGKDKDDTADVVSVRLSRLEPLP